MYVLMCNEEVNLTMKETISEIPKSSSSSKELVIPTPFSGPLSIDKPLEIVIFTPKGVLCWLTRNINYRIAQSYNIVEDLSHAQCALSTLKVWQIFTAQHSAY